ncbi:hypothetical protein KUW14_02455 [Pseudooceanicola nitratireducens]|nr:hypothetical protein [Pseudooceanicola nitratireducens]MBY6164697.1 hypothetical protein [Pseudooceanicola nitratireducens]MEC7794460.1 hypothetical protein [Pseudomonadota bacterium]
MIDKTKETPRADQAHQPQQSVPDWRRLDFASDCLCLRSEPAPDTPHAPR